ncbi:hypothetical protein [uncultured Demequina sp.]|uniref:hypothetical protein n=1 Tax=uncultured Demequina sp. TaxID=693499 RepID=UPI0025ED0F9C|nr:hypothetical protein [uncultured Demequina sp.]
MTDPVLVAADGEPLLPANYDVMWTIMMVAFAAGIVVTLVALVKAYLRMREREREEKRRRGDDSGNGDSGGADIPPGR